MENHFHESDILKKDFEDRWVKFAFGPQGQKDTKEFNLGIVEFDPDKASLAHRHDVSEVLYVLEGRGKVLLEEDEVPVEKGDFLYVPEGAQHQLVTGPSRLKILFIFSGKIMIDY